MRNVIIRVVQVGERRNQKRKSNKKSKRQLYRRRKNGFTGAKLLPHRENYRECGFTARVWRQGKSTLPDYAFQR